MENKIPILLIDDDKNLLHVYEKIFRMKGFDIIALSDSIEALETVKKQQISVVISDVIMPRLDGMALLERIREASPQTEVIMLTAEGSVPDAVKAVRQGAFSYMLKPVDIEELLFNVERAYELFSIKEENSVLKQQITEIAELEPLVGTSAVMEEIREQALLVAPLDATVLITGESGTGKEILANMIHYNSRRRDKPFVRVNCAALPASLLESELFGHEKGAFTGADRIRKGRFEMANGGTLLLDEIGELPLNLQATLLRVLQEKEFERVGGSVTLKTNFRLIAATNKNLARETQENRFRQDLYYRINVLPLVIPPLRERAGDIAVLTDYFINRLSGEMKKPAPRIEPRAMALLEQYGWPGNVRQLRNVIERILVLAKGNMISEQDIPEEIRGGVKQAEPFQLPVAGGLLQARKEFEKEYIVQSLKYNEWNVTKTALQLNLARKNLYKKLKEYDIDLR